MKKVFVLMLVLASISVTSVASAQKIGRVAFQEIVLVLPEADSIQGKITKYAEQLDADLEQMRVELNNKFEDYQKKQATFSTAINEQKQKELNDYNTRIQEFAKTAQRDIEEMQFKLTQPLFLKVQAAIKNVSVEKALTIVVDLSQGNNVMYIDEATTLDITPLVKVSLGVAADAKPKQQPQQMQ